MMSLILKLFHRNRFQLNRFHMKKGFLKKQCLFIRLSVRYQQKFFLIYLRYCYKKPIWLANQLSANLLMTMIMMLIWSHVNYVALRFGNFKPTFYLNAVSNLITPASILRKITFYRFYPYQIFLKNLFYKINAVEN